VGNIPELIIAVAALISSLGGAAAAIIVALRAGRKQAVKVVKAEKENGGADTLPTDKDNGLSVEDAKSLLELIGKLNPPAKDDS
jgi:hypothetical protein